ncbi:MAG: MucB/RseB C-terminal domain-containing protein [Gammaproteobacteria bacterium]|nr:MucB/RseB C-terminal domain-containing protein [Gammaproteobacteria bacterium]
MMSVNRWGIACFLSCLPLANVLAEASSDAVKHLLEKAIVSARTLNYEGTFVYSHDDAIDTLRVIHKHDETGEHERLISLTGRSNEVIRQQDHVQYRFADKEAYGAYMAEDDAQRLVAHLAAKYDQLTALYEFHVFNGQRIAGKDTQGFLIQPRDHFRYGYQLWLDDDTGLVLKSQLLGETGPVETLMFTEIQYRQFIPEEMVRIDSKILTLAKQVMMQELTARWEPSWLPQGFRIARAVQRRENSQRLVLSDGMSMVSIFIEPFNKQTAPKHRFAHQGFANNGATNGYTLVNGDHRITAVGEVPSTTVQRIAQSFTAH